MENQIKEAQLSQEWFDIRVGRFTGSQMFKLMTGGKRDMTEQELEDYKRDNPKGKRTTVDTMFGDTALTYIFEKACDIVFGRNEEEQFDTFDMQRGRTLEPVIFAKFKELKEAEFMTVEETSFFVYGDNAGASPDCLVDKDAIGEFKAPRAPKFFKLVKDGYSAIDFEYIVQMQTEIMVTNSKRCHFFNYIIYNGKPMWHEIIVERDEAMIEKIKERIAEAVKVRDEYVKQLQANIQF